MLYQKKPTFSTINEVLQEGFLPQVACPFCRSIVLQCLPHEWINPLPDGIDVWCRLIVEQLKYGPDETHACTEGVDVLQRLKRLSEGPPGIICRRSALVQCSGCRLRKFSGECVEVLSEKELGSSIDGEAGVKILEINGLIRSGFFGKYGECTGGVPLE